MTDRSHHIDLAETQWVQARHLNAGEYLVEWHDEDGRGLFGKAPEAHRITEVRMVGRPDRHTVTVRTAALASCDYPHSFQPDQQVEIEGVR